MGISKSRIKWLTHIVLLVLFIASAILAVVLWATSDDLESAGIVATIALFWATASAFVERIFPMDD